MKFERRASILPATVSGVELQLFIVLPTCYKFEAMQGIIVSHLGFAYISIYCVVLTFIYQVCLTWRSSYALYSSAQLVVTFNSSKGNSLDGFHLLILDAISLHFSCF